MPDPLEDLDRSSPVSGVPVVARRRVAGDAPGTGGSRNWLLAIATASLVASVLALRAGGVGAHALGYALVCFGDFIPIALWRRWGYRRLNEHGVAVRDSLMRFATALLVVGLGVSILHTAFLARDVEPYVSRWLGIT